MSVSLMLARVPSDVNSLDDITEEKILEIGTKLEITEVISRICPDASFSGDYYYLPRGNPADLLISAYSCWKVYLGNEDPVKIISVSPHVGKCSLKIIEDICQQLECRIIDLQHSKFINFNHYP